MARDGIKLLTVVTVVTTTVGTVVIPWSVHQCCAVYQAKLVKLQSGLKTNKHKE